MSCNRIATAFKLAGVALCLLFFAQLAIGQLEHAGLLGCETPHATTAKSGETKELPTESCHHACCNVPCFTADGIRVASPFYTRSFFHLTDEVIPDGPVKTIDHPPQLS